MTTIGIIIIIVCSAVALVYTITLLCSYNKSNNNQVIVERESVTV